MKGPWFWGLGDNDDGNPGGVNIKDPSISVYAHTTRPLLTVTMINVYDDDDYSTTPDVIVMPLCH